MIGRRSHDWQVSIVNPLRPQPALPPDCVAQHACTNIVKRAGEEKRAALQTVLIARWENYTTGCNPMYYMYHPVREKRQRIGLFSGWVRF